MAESPSIVVGAPTNKRAWILHLWYDAMMRSVGAAPVELQSLVFVMNHHDPDTLRVVNNFAAPKVIVLVDEPDRPDYRHWPEERIHHMVELRNVLLRTVRSLNPKYFLSLDTDILLAEPVVSNLIETHQDGRDAWVVGGKTYMSPGTSRCDPSYWHWTPDQWFRDEAEGVFPVDVVMAIKLMDRRAYHVDYKFHEKGEDLGWSFSVREAGGGMLWDGRVASKHVMSPDWLEKVDTRVGY